MKENTIKNMLAIILLPFVLLLQGFVLSKLWLWFVMPLGVPAISIVHAMGITILFNLFNNNVSHEKETLETFIIKILSGFTKSLIILLLGFIVQLFM